MAVLNDRGEVRAAGGLVWRPAGCDGAVEVLLVHRPAYDDWTLPKGKVDAGETDPDAALREVAEETGLCCRLGPELGTVRYVDHQGRPKSVRYWAMEVAGGQFTPNPEVDRVAWVPPGEAGRRLTYGRDAQVLDRFALSAPAAAAGADPVLVVRHASAGSRRAWAGDDALRPLDGWGEAQARALAGQLAPFGVTRIASSPWLRCVQTVQPLADRLGLSVESEPLLGEGRGPAAAALVGSAPPGGLVMCTHADVVPLLLSALTGRPPEGDAACGLGATWLVTGPAVAGRRAATYLKSPA